MLEIRRMQLEDLEAVMQIEEASFSVPWTKDDFAQSLKQNGAIYLVAINDDIIVGYCGLWGILDEGQINNVAVSNEHRKRGIGGMMLSRLIDEGEKEGLTAFTLEVRAQNAPAIALYKKNGFVEAGVRKDYYSKPKEDALIMWKYIEGNKN